MHSRQKTWERPIENVKREMILRHASRIISNRADNADSRGNVVAAEFYYRLMDMLMSEGK